MTDPSADGKSIEIRLDGAKVAQQTSRLALFTATVAALGFVLVVFNSYYSWTALTEVYHREALKTLRMANQHDSTIFGDMRRDYFSEWMKNRAISVSTLGIRLTVDDVVLVCSASMSIISLWFLYAMRREKLVIGSLLHDTRDLPNSLRRLVFHGIASYAMFSTIGESTLLVDGQRQTVQRGSNWILGRVFHVLCFQPLIVILFVFLADVCSLFRVFPFGDGEMTYWDYILKHKLVITLFVWYSISFVFTTATAWSCLQAYRFACDVEIALTTYYGQLQAQAYAPQQPPAGPNG